MTTVGTKHEWYRFLEVGSEDEVVSELRRFASALDLVYGDLMKASWPLHDAPAADIGEALRISRIALSEAIEVLHDTAARFSVNQHQSV